MNIGLIIAGGIGARVNNSTPKQFITVKGKPVIVHTLEVFEKNPQIDAVAVVCLSGWEDMLRKYAREYGLSKLCWIVKGGETGMASLRNGMELLREKCSPDDIIVIHDAVRPLLTDDIINSNIASVLQYGTAVTYIPATEALLYSDDGETSSEVIDRNKIFRTQTPQSLRLSKFIWAHEEAKKRGITDTVSTCTLLIELGETVHFVRGINSNLKITTAEDFALLSAYIDSEGRRNFSGGVFSD